MLTRFKHINSLESHDLVYNINCNDCDANYSGNTKRKLEIRVKEHKSALNKSYVHSNI
jgi:predicted GIY-YIG superfamily endonuclease